MRGPRAGLVTNDTLQPTACDTNKANAVTKASLRILRDATGCMSIGITQVGIYTDIEFTQGVHDPIVTGINDNRGLGPNT